MNPDRPEIPPAADSDAWASAEHGAARDSSDDAPFVIGVSGHRDFAPQDAERVRAAVRTFIEQIRALLPDTQIRIMTGMASGADLLAARVALEEGLTVDAVLPLPLEDYAADFAPAALEELKTLLAHPQVRCTELPLEPDGAARSEACAPPRRDAHYLNLARTLIERCHLLLAVWDGEPSVRAGGTADTVLRYLGLRSDRRPQGRPVLIAGGAEEPDAPLAYWIPVTRRGDAPPDRDAARRASYLSGLGDDALQRWVSMPQRLKTQLGDFNAYQRDLRELRARGAPLQRSSSLLSALPEEVLTPAARPWLERIDAQYRKADALAVHYQVRSDRLFVFFTLSTFAMGLSYLAYDKFVASPLLLFAYLLVLLSGFGLFYLLEGRRWFSKHLMYRALAETLRVKFYLSVAGADRLVDVEDILALVGIHRFEGFSWLSCVLIGLGRPAECPASHTDDPSLAAIEAAWLDSQHGYFARKVERLERIGRRTLRLRRILFVIILLTIGAIILAGRTAWDTPLASGISLGNALAFILGLPALVLGVWELHQNKMAARELLWQYRHQLDHFARARARLARTNVPAHRRRVLAGLGKDSLMESYLWTIHRYHREHEPGRG
jgi:hypothetical protein